ncbi:hypothetical protein A1O3_09460 [Capronia epimyces CBS 606.96]|uniref:Transcription factor domain-containing protein n=1 Tax=Capronia epimyces CBS 606.96 TaxID=1182542 RepID=W9Y7B4_9EURO|nr:uncharacterized protein A1O3_09460 [Capronia epimyces CBS 606.96]EXJ78299.1 hypothetical protein A1O3_09460 [Capronia epimyces CBS 606.96]
MAVNEIGGSMLIPVMSDTSLCLSVIAAWKAVQFQAGQAASFPYLSYEAQALQSLRKQLHVMGPRRVTDEAVIAAAILWATAAMFAQPEPLRRHVAGVRALVAARGGLADLGHAGSTAQLILWADLLTAQFLDEDVCFKDIGPSDPLPPSLVKLRASIALPPPFDRLLPDTSEAARDMRLLLLCHDKALRTEHISFAEYKALMGLLNQSTIFWVGLQEKYKGSSTSDECVILAMNLLRLTVFFHAAPLLTIVTTVLERLRLALVRCGIGQFLDSVDIYIWACLVGMVNNLHADARSQFADMLAHALTTKYKNGWPVDWQAEILLLLRSFLWSDSVLTTMLPAACQLVEARVCPTKKTCLATQSVTLS